MCFLIFFWFVAHDFMFLTGLLKEQLSIYGEEQSATFSCVACALCALLKKLLPNPRSERFTPVISSKSFIVVVLTFISMMGFDLIFVLHCELRVLLHLDIQLVKHHLLKKLFFPPLNYLGTFTKIN